MRAQILVDFSGRDRWGIMRGVWGIKLEPFLQNQRSSDLLKKPGDIG